MSGCWRQPIRGSTPDWSVASDPGTEQERRELRVERYSVGKSTLRKLVAWLDDGRRQQAAPVQRSKASGSAGVATRRVALARETRFGRRPKLSRPASELELDKSNDRSFSTQMPKGVPQGSANPGLTIQALAARTADYLITQGAKIFNSDKRDMTVPPVRHELSPPGTHGVGVPRLR